MAGVPVPAYQQFWMDKQSLLENEPQSIMDKYPDAAPVIKLLFKVVCDIEELFRFTPVPVGQFTPHDLCDEDHERQVEAGVQALLEAADNDPPKKIKPCALLKLISSLKLRKVYGIDGIPNECLTVHLTHFINHCIRLSHFPTPWKEAKVTALLKPSKDPKFPRNLCLINFLSAMGKLFEKVVLKIVQRHIENRKLLNANHFGFRAHHSMTLQSLRLVDHVTLNFKNKMSTATAFLDIEKAFVTTWHTNLLYKLSKLEFLANLIKLLAPFYPIENSEFLWRASCLRLDIWKPGHHKVPPCPPHYITCILMILPKLQVCISLSLRTIPVCM
jgi:hypothetical protein